MAENGGPVFEGSANFTPPKKGMVEKLKQKVSKEQLSATANKVRERVKDRLSQNTGMIVEKKWMDAYQKTVDALDPGKRKKVAEKLKIVAVGVSKIARVGSAVGDFVLRWGGLLDVMGGAYRIARPASEINSAKNVLNRLYELDDAPGVNTEHVNDLVNSLEKIASKTPKQIRIEGGKGVAKGLAEGFLAKARISRVAAGWMGDIAGVGGEKWAQITNKILSGKPKAEIPAPQTAT